VALIVADTDVLIDALRGRGEAERVAEALRLGRLASTAVTLFELLSGASELEERERVQALLGAMTLFPFDEPAAERAAGARLALELEGRAIGSADLQIAGICLSRDLPLWTRNRAHFERIQGLALLPV
jgi:predicted nucleic acid-binding protein